MAGIVINPDSTEKEGRIVRARQKAIKKGDRVAGVLKVTERLWLQTEVQVPSSSVRQQFDVSGACFEMLEDGGLVSSEGFE